MIICFVNGGSILKSVKGMKSEIKEEIKKIFGKELFSDSLIDLISYSYDASDHHHRPDCIVWPEDKLQVCHLLSLANIHGFPVIPRGAGTGLAGGAVPVEGGVVVDTCRMNKILEISIEDRVAVVQPGVVYEDLDRILSRYGYFYPPDPASSRVCTIGGNVATNAGGLRGAKYGVTKHYVLGLEVVLPDGRIVKTGTRCMKSVSGYDLTSLFIGSEGTLGIITEITIKISPLPKEFKTLLCFFPTLKDAAQAVCDIIHAGIIPSALEILDENSIALMRQSKGIELPPSEAMLLIETDGFTHKEAEAQMAKVYNIVLKNRVVSVEKAERGEDRERLWDTRKMIGSIGIELGPDHVSEDVAMPISLIPEMITKISEIIKKFELPFLIFGHAGDGNLHPKIIFHSKDKVQLKKVRKAVDEIFKVTCKAGGTLTGEHGIGLEKAPYMSYEHDPISMEMMRALKRIFDPKNILNPGKMNL